MGALRHHKVRWNVGTKVAVFTLPPLSPGGPRTVTFLHTYGRDGADPYAAVVAAHGVKAMLSPVGGTARLRHIVESGHILDVVLNKHEVNPLVEGPPKPAEVIPISGSGSCPGDRRSLVTAHPEVIHPAKRALFVHIGSCPGGECADSGPRFRLHVGHLDEKLLSVSIFERRRSSSLASRCTHQRKATPCTRP